MKNVIKALASFQQEVPVIHKGTQGYGYQYADLPTILEVINPILKSNGLSYIQTLNSKDGITYLNTSIVHLESGEMIDSSVEIPKISIAKMNDYQSFGSGITYFRRYSLAVSLSLITDIDNDANGEQIRAKKVIQEVNEEKPKLSVAQFNKLIGAIKTGITTQSGEKYTVELAIKVYDLTNEQLQTLKTLENE